MLSAYLMKPSWGRYTSLRTEKLAINSDDDGTDDVSSTTSSSAALDRREHRRRGFMSVRLLSQLMILGVGLIAGLAIGLACAWIRWHHDRNMAAVSPARSFAPQMPLSMVVFDEIPELYDPPSNETNAYWDALVPPGLGFIQIPHPKTYGLQPGIETDTGFDRFSVAMNHQLHCVAIIRRFYWNLIDALRDGRNEPARLQEVHDQLHGHHTHHCFAYLVQAILCNADLTIEWARVEDDGSRYQVDGWGVPHQCKDPEAVRGWLDEHHSPPRVNGTHLDGTPD